jgi:hypothetical protein
MDHMIKRILNIFRRRPSAEEVAHDILQEIMQHMARRQMEIEESQSVHNQQVNRRFHRSPDPPGCIKMSINRHRIDRPSANQTFRQSSTRWPLHDSRAAAGAGLSCPLHVPADRRRHRARHRCFIPQCAYLMISPFGRMITTVRPCLRPKRIVDHVPPRGCSMGSAGAAMSAMVSSTISLLRSPYGFSRFII